jgi:3-hydroxymyristoyl/3-hydroxydecanoyl-(acyl carrier protein) dehydratase
MNFREAINTARVSGPETNPAGATTFTFRFPATDPTFAGHFPTRPLVPGVFQLEIARIAAELTLKQSLLVREITKAKFLRPIIPDETIRVELKLAEKADMIQARASFSITGQAAGEVILQLTRNQ